MANFEVPEEAFRLRFDTDHHLHGMEVVIRSGSVGAYLQMATLADIIAGGVKDPSNVERVRTLLSAFADNLVEWNATRNKKKIPATISGVMTLDLNKVIVPIIEAWMEAIAGVSPPLPQTSSDSESLPEGLEIPMEVLSGSL